VHNIEAMHTSTRVQLQRACAGDKGAQDQGGAEGQHVRGRGRRRQVPETAQLTVEWRLGGKGCGRQDGAEEREARGGVG
jgi:hypothetical protein